MEPGHNPFAPPKADLAPRERHAGAFFPVGIPKLIFLWITTLGFYAVYWMYKNWQLVQDREAPNIMPFWRGIFGVIWLFPLARLIHERAQSDRISPGFQPNVVGGLFLLFNLLSRLPDPLWMLSIFSFLPIIAVQKCVNTINEELPVAPPPNNRLAGWNWAALLFGGLFYLLILLGLMVPEV